MLYTIMIYHVEISIEDIQDITGLRFLVNMAGQWGCRSPDDGEQAWWWSHGNPRGFPVFPPVKQPTVAVPCSRKHTYENIP